MAVEFTRRSLLNGLSCLFASGAARTYAAATGTGKPKLSFGVLSDVHITPRAACDEVRARMGLGPIADGRHRYIETDRREKALRWWNFRQTRASTTTPFSSLHSQVNTLSVT